ncbi:MAG: hypothetical protein R3B45_02140 [Bdellovibrionota bacterium]
MNQQPEDQSGVNSTYSSQPGTQTNPFTADLKGEFTSNFGTNTNAVSQIFKEGQFSQGKSKIFIGVGAVLVVLFAAYYFLMEDGSDDDFAVLDEPAGQEDTALEDDTVSDAVSDESAPADKDGEIANAGSESVDEVSDFGESEESAVASQGATDTQAAVATSEALPPATDIPVLVGPANGASRSYDETSTPAEFSWEGSPGGYIAFSRNRSMEPMVMKIRVSGNSYKFNHPWPGTWYWRVDNGAGSSEVRSFRISSVVRRNVQVSQPQSGSALSGNGGVVSWTGDTGVAHYRVEFTNSGWANPTHRFATSGTQMTIQGVQPGQYQMRVGAFSEVAGRWEFTNPMSVTVQ